MFEKINTLVFIYISSLFVIVVVVIVIIIFVYVAVFVITKFQRKNAKISVIVVSM